MDRFNKLAKQGLENVPEGSLRLNKSNGCAQFYHCKNDTSHNGVYISKKNRDLARQLAQKSYDEKILRYTENSLSLINRLLIDYEDDKLDRIYMLEHSERQKMIEPVEPTYDQLLEKWMSEDYARKAFREDSPIIVTNNGMRVRSKSEKIMADYFDSIGLTYKYECPLQLEPFGIIYPDFTFLSKKTKRKIYWEHEGMMDNSEYARVAVQKIELYERNGIFPGEDLILTFESSNTPINTVLMKDLTKRYIL